VDTQALRNFLVIVECGSITRAADRLGIAQPSLSQQLLRIEDELGVKLFKRTARGVAVTDAGRLFQEHALNILQSMLRAREEVRQHEAKPGAVVSFGMSRTTAQLLAVPLLVAAREEYPDIRLRIREGGSGALKRWLEQGRIDLAMLYDADEAQTLSVKRIAIEPMLFIGPANEFGEADEHGIALEPVDRAALDTCTMIQPTVENRVRRLVERHTGSGAVNLKVDIEIDSLTHIRALVAAGMGYSVLSHAAVADDLAAGRLSAARVQGLNLRRSVSLVRNPTQTITQASIQVEDLAMRILREMIGDGRWLTEESAVR